MMNIRKVICSIIFIFVGCCFIAYAEYYKVNVTRVDQDLYKDTYTGIYIKTKYCYEYVWSEDAILKYESYAYDNKLIFEDKNSCDVDKIFK